MRTSARVRDVRDGRAWLACETAASACDACNGGCGCALRWLARAEGAVFEVPGILAGILEAHEPVPAWQPSRPVPAELTLAD